MYVAIYEMYAGIQQCAKVDFQQLTWCGSRRLLAAWVILLYHDHMT